MTTSSIAQTLDQLKSSEISDLEAVSAIAAHFRQQFVQDGAIEVALTTFTAALADVPERRQHLGALIDRVLNEYNFLSFFSQFSILDEVGFASGIWARLKNKLIPTVPAKTDIQYLLKTALDLPQDRKWIRLLPRDTLRRLFGTTGLAPNTEHLKDELGQAILVLGTKISSFGMDHRVRTLYRQLELDTQPFYELQAKLTTPPAETTIPHLQSLLNDIYLSISSLRLRKREIGTTLKLTYQSSRTLAKLAILRDLLTLRADETKAAHWATVLKNSVSSELSRPRLRKFINGHLDLVSLEIVEHTAKSGEKYIADNPKEYFGIFRGSLLGGFLIALFATAKVYLDSLPVGQLPEALLFSFNYATCFVLVKVFGGIIATKQPAMVASTIIKHVDENNDLKLSSLSTIITLIKKASRSQLISFVGNLAIAFPLAVGIYWVLTYQLGYAFVDTTKAEKLLKSIWPFAGGAVAYAAIAGVFLSISGLISGYVDNKVVASNLHTRIVQHQLLTALFSPTKRTKIADYLCEKLGSLSGNTSLGFLLGMAGYVGFITGLPIDIRHIAFSSANFGFAFLPVALSGTEILLATLSILLIGTINFAVSFGITLYIALKSRGITFVNTFKLLLFLLKELVLRPWTFLLLPRKKTKPTT